jgi:hypothetical protein
MWGGKRSALYMQASIDGLYVTRKKFNHFRQRLTARESESVICFLHTGFVPVATSEFSGGSVGRYGCAGWTRQREEEIEETIYLHPVAGGQTCICYY